MIKDLLPIKNLWNKLKISLSGIERTQIKAIFKIIGIFLYYAALSVGTVFLTLILLILTSKPAKRSRSKNGTRNFQ